MGGQTAAGQAAANQVAAVLVMSDRRVQQLAREGVLPKVGRGRYDLIGCVQAYIRHLRSKLKAGAEYIDPADYNSQRVRLTRAKADEQELSNEQAAGRLLPVDVVVQHFAGGIAVCKSHLMGIPDQFASRYPELPVDVITDLRLMIRNASDELADGIPDRAS